MKRIRKFIESTTLGSPVILAQILSLLMIIQVFGWFCIMGSSLTSLPNYYLFGIMVFFIGIVSGCVAVPTLIDILVNKTIFGSADRVL